MSPIRAAVIGLGEISRIHFAALEQLENVVLAAVCDVLPEKEGLYPGVPFYQSYEEMLQGEQPDCVHICLPHYLHYPAALAAAQAGCHVFCEKPLALNAGEARQFAALEQRFPMQRFGVCLQNRKNESIELLKELLLQKETGAVTGMTATVLWNRDSTYYSQAPWRGRMKTAGGGVLINQSIHTLDLLQYLGGYPVSVSGSVSRLLGYDGVEVEDTASALLTFPGGAKGYFNATIANCRDDSVSLSVSTEGASYLIRDNTLYRAGKDGLAKLAEDSRLPGKKFYYGASHARLIAQFYQEVAAGKAGYIPVSEGVASMELIDAVVASSQANGAPQELPPLPAPPFHPIKKVGLITWADRKLCV